MLVLALLTTKNLLLAGEGVWHGNKCEIFFYCLFSSVPFCMCVRNILGFDSIQRVVPYVTYCQLRCAEVYYLYSFFFFPWKCIVRYGGLTSVDQRFSVFTKVLKPWWIWLQVHFSSG